MEKACVIWSQPVAEPLFTQWDCRGAQQLQCDGKPPLAH